jgi:hypothetical protein
MMVAVYLWLHNKEPEMQQYAINEDGFMWGQQLMTWEHCKAFWIVQHQNHFELHVAQRRFLFPETCVCVPEAQVQAVFEAMSAYAEYDGERGEGWINYLVRVSKL